jgi:formylglycine-generating enzyme required for sulfatase activity
MALQESRLREPDPFLARGNLMRNHNRSNRLRILLSAAAIALLAGCNNNSAKRPAAGTASNPAAGQAAAPEVAQAPNAPRENPARPAAKAKPKVAQVEKPRPGLDPGVNPLDVFTVVPGETKWQLASVDGKPVSDNEFTAILPPKGVDSTRFRPLDTDKPTAGSAKRQTSATKRTEPTSPSHKSPEKKAPEKKAPEKKATERKSTDRKSSDRKSGDRKTADRKLAERKTEEAEPTEPAASEEGKRLPPGFRALASAQQTALGWPSRIRCEKDGAEMALVTGGAVVVGHDGGPDESKPQLTVVIDSFYMDVTEVTVGQFERFRKALREDKGRNVVTEPGNVSAPHQEPVMGVSLTQAQFYAKWAGKELPTESEWERAARGEGAFDHPWGNGRAIWKHPRTRDEIDPVKSFRTDLSPFGIYDLAGNAREWCVDHYSPTAFADALKSSSGQLRNWKGPRVSHPENARVVKGNGPNWDAWYRVGMDGAHGHPNVGFRCVLRLPEKEN